MHDLFKLFTSKLVKEDPESLKPAEAWIPSIYKPIKALDAATLLDLFICSGCLSQLS